MTTTIQVGGAALVVISLSDCHEQFATALAHLSAVLNLGEFSLHLRSYQFREKSVAKNWTLVVLRWNASNHSYNEYNYSLLEFRDGKYLVKKHRSRAYS